MKRGDVRFFSSFEKGMLLFAATRFHWQINPDVHFPPVRSIMPERGEPGFPETRPRGAIHDRPNTPDDHDRPGAGRHNGRLGMGSDPGAGPDPGRTAGKRLSSVAETVSTYYQRFPTRQGLSTLDSALQEQIQTDVRLARIDIFTVVNYDIDYIEYIAGASRVRYEWPESLVSSVAASRKPQYMSDLQTEDGPARGCSIPSHQKNPKRHSSSSG